LLQAFSLAGTAAAALLCPVQPATAQTFKDASLQVWLQQDRTTELRRAARDRLAAQPGDSQAVLALALTSLDGNDAAARQEAISRAQACTQQQPQVGVCHYALGVVLGTSRTRARPGACAASACRCALRSGAGTRYRRGARGSLDAV
jgi:hypothetical protein